jgi:hypothetical protein
MNVNVQSSTATTVLVVNLIWVGSLSDRVENKNGLVGTQTQLLWHVTSHLIHWLTLADNNGCEDKIMTII